MTIPYEPRGVHLTLLPLDPPGSTPRRWQCQGCEAIADRINDLHKIECTAPMPAPCEWCGQTPICDLHCTGVALALGGVGIEADVKVIGPEDEERYAKDE